VCARFNLDSGLNVMVVVGGSQGSKALNDLVFGAVGRTTHGEGTQLEGWQVLWATGPAHHSNVDAALAGSQTSVPVRTVPYIEDIPSALSIAHMAVSRAGAMTTAELLAWGVPAILVPLPTAAANHQELNARALQEAGAAIHLRQADNGPEVLWNEMVALAEDGDRLEAMSRSARDRSRPEATAEIVTEMTRLLPEPQRKAGA
jgi:UDP-N-acetylglucosamine--N-acetylmuramyl-(pentapeptide) pyrophosphoryl-undecaprenol N-acetylglucosamine transferase